MPYRKLYPIARLNCPYCKKTIILKRAFGLYRERKRKEEGGD